MDEFLRTLDDGRVFVDYGPASMVITARREGEPLSELAAAAFPLIRDSLAEIAEEQNISRQGVHDAIARAEQALKTMEAQIGSVARHRRTQAALEEIERQTAALAASPDPAAAAAARQIQAILDTIKE